MAWARMARQRKTIKRISTVGEATVHKHIPAHFITLYYINHLGGEGLEAWASMLHKGFRWARIGCLALYIPKARRELNLASTCVFLEGAAAVSTQGSMQEDAFERVSSLTAPDPVAADELWLWDEEYKSHRRNNDTP
ncbi:MAG: hypothetical protein ACOC6S_02620 [Chloroflexota bacterium]